MLVKAGKVLQTLVTQSTGANGSELPGMDCHSPRSCASDPCSVSSLSTSPESTPMRARPGAESPSATSAVQVTLLSAEDAHAPLVAAARQGRILHSNADPAASNGHPKRASLASSPLPSKLLAIKANGQKAGVSSKQSSGSGSALIPARPPSRMAAAVAVAKAESSGDLMGFLSMLAARQTGSKAAVELRSRDDSSLPVQTDPIRDYIPNGCDGVCSEASTSSLTLGNGSDLPSRAAAAEGAPGSGGAVPSGSMDLVDGDAWLAGNGDVSTAEEGGDWVAKKGSLRWIKQRGGGAEVDGGGPIRRRARRGNRARGEMGYALLRGPWTWGDNADAGATEPDQDAGMLRSVSHGGLSHDSDSAFGCEQYFGEQDEEAEGDVLECSSSAEKGSKGKWFNLSGGQSTEDLLNAFTKDLAAADEPPAKFNQRCLLAILLTIFLFARMTLNLLLKGLK